MPTDPLTAVYGMIVLMGVGLLKDLLHTRKCASRDEVKDEMEKALARRDDKYETLKIREFILAHDKPAKRDRSE